MFDWVIKAVIAKMKEKIKMMYRMIQRMVSLFDIAEKIPFVAVELSVG